MHSIKLHNRLRTENKEINVINRKWQSNGPFRKFYGVNNPKSPSPLIYEARPLKYIHRAREYIKAQVQA